jgi:riboflavin biosynthesis pyrimidine reductase
MAASVDGRIAVGGRSAALSSAADRELFHALRARADAVFAAAGTVRAERYGPIIRNPETQAARVAAGRPAQPLAVIASRSLNLDPGLPLLNDPDSHVVIVGASSGTIAGARARVDYVRAAQLSEALAELKTRFCVATLVCEGGPSLNAALQSEGLIDELFLSRAPLLVGGEPGASLIAGEAPPLPQTLALRMLLSCEDHLYARYAVS